MQEPKKPNNNKDIPPEEMTYPTPPLDPNTGAPLDTRFQSAPSQEVAQPQPKSGGKEEETEEDDEKPTRPKSTEKPQRRR